MTGIDVEQREWKGTMHEFLGMAAGVDAARDAHQYAADRLVQSLRSK